jgi:hypothetical protein
LVPEAEDALGLKIPFYFAPHPGSFHYIHIHSIPFHSAHSNILLAWSRKQKKKAESDKLEQAITKLGQRRKVITDALRYNRRKTM